MKNEDYLYKNNKIIKAKYDLTTIQNRVYQYILFKMQQNSKDAPAGIYEAYIHYSELKEIIKNRNEQTIANIKNLLTVLRKGTIYIEKHEKTGYKKWHEYSFISGYDYDEETQMFRIEASATIYNLLKNYMEGGYTPINIVIFLSLGNSNAQRIYELLRLWTRPNQEKIIEYTVDDLKMYMELENKYKRYPDFNRRVLKPAVKELNEKAKLEIEIEEIKSGRKVVSLRFKVKDKDKKIKDKQNKDKELPKPPVDNENNDIKDDYYIPPELRLDSSSINHFKAKYKDFDFRSPLIQNFLFEAEAITLSKDNAESIYYKNFNYFTTILDSKLIEYKHNLFSSLNEDNNYDDDFAMNIRFGNDEDY